MILLSLVSFCCLVAIADGYGCRTGWTLYKDKCYMFSRVSEPWGAASSYCQAFHSKLAEPVTPEETHFLSQHSHSLKKIFWIGMTDLIKEGEWVYSSNLSPVSTNSTNWGPHEPNGRSGQNCVVVNGPWHGYWSDVHCDVSEHFVCEMTVEESGPVIIG